MLKGLTNTFKNNCNNIELTYSEYVVLNGTIIPVKATFNDDVYENGNFIGSFIFKTLKFETDATYDFKNKEFEYYKKVNNESIKIGTFISTEVEINDTTEITKVVAMDYGLKTQIEYKSTLDYASGNITLLDVWNECCTLSGLTSGINTFPNDDFIVDSDQFTGTGATIRNVFRGIAMSSGTFVKVMNDDRIYLIFNETTNDIIEDYVELEDKRDTHPWTCLRLGMTDIEGEHVDYIDDELVEEYGENWLIINDNPFAYTQQKREQLIENIYNQIKEFGYSAFVSKTSFKPYLTTGDIIQFRNRDGNLVNSIILRYEHNGEDIKLEAPSETSATISYVKPTTAIDAIKRTEYKVDKAEGNITLLTQQTTEIGNNLSENYYNIEQVNTLVQNAESGVINTFTQAGGNNLLRNTAPYFMTNDTEAEFWDGAVARITDTDSSNGYGLLLQNGSTKQTVALKNNYYTLSFKYKMLIPLTTAMVKYNGRTISLTEEEGEIATTGLVSEGSLTFEAICDTNNGMEIYELMLNTGEVALEWSQNANEMISDYVQISKGVKVSSSVSNTLTTMESDGFKVKNKSTNETVMEATETGARFKEITAGKGTIAGLLIEKVEDEVWITGV